MKARREESWLQEKYPEYAAYKSRVKKLIPWVY
jgi:protein-S-isoprenylcysteine O-methyltransferase Ste14